VAMEDNYMAKRDSVDGNHLIRRSEDLQARLIQMAKQTDQRRQTNRKASHRTPNKWKEDKAKNAPVASLKKN
jgi:hypothetical protein